MDVERAQFARDGYIVRRSLFDEGDVRVMRRCMDRLRDFGSAHLASLPETTLSEFKVPYRGSEVVLARDAGADQIKRVLWAGAAEPSLLRYGRDPRLTSIVARLLDASWADHLINQVHFKLPNDGVDDYDWHQDATHRRYGTAEWTDVDGCGSYVQSLIAIDENAIDNGPLYVLPGGYGFLGNLKDADGVSRLPAGFDEGVAVPVLLSPGDAVLFGPYLLHKSEPNMSDRSRYVLINGFAAPGANRRIYPGVGSASRIRLR